MIEDWIEVSEAVNDSERAALAELIDMLHPAPERFTLVSNVRLPNGRHDFYEYDVIIVAEAMLFVLEIKGYGGRIVCQRDRWYLENGLSVENPSNRLSIKAKTLGSLLLGRYRGLRGKLWVQDFVYVNGPNARLTDADYARRASFDVIGTSFDRSTRGEFKRALLDTKRWNSRAEPFDADERKGIIAYLRGGEKRVVDDRLGKYLIEERLIATSERFERLLARDRLKPKESAERVELHVYRLDGRRETDARIAHELERQIDTVRRLGDLGVAPRYLLDDEAERQGRQVRYVAYEWLGSLKTLGDRIASSGAPSLRESLRLAIAVGEALATMHDQGIVHGALDPSSLYLRESRGAAPQVVIGRIELARPANPEGSIASIGTVGSAASCYASPEVLGNRRPTVEDDLFSFGAMLAHILRGRPLFASPGEILQRIHLPRLLEDRSADPAELQALVRELLARSPASRPTSMREVAARLRAVLRPLEESRGEPDRIGRYRILRELRAGATGRTVAALRDDLDGEIVLKIAPLGNDEMLRGEVEHLRALHHQNIVTAYTVSVFEAEQLTIGEFASVPGEDGQRMRARLLGEHIAPFAHGLFSALAYVHERGLVHRDVKPANVMIGADGKATLLDFGLAAAPGDTNLIVGTAPYKPKVLFERGAWLAADDVFAAAVTFWEIVTGVHPWHGAAPDGAPTIQADALGALLSKDVAAMLAATIRELIETPPANAAPALQALERVLRPTLDAPLLPIGPPEIVLPAEARLTDSVGALNLSAAARRALEALEVTTLGDVRVLRLADLPRVKGFGRGVAEEIQALGLALTARFGEPEPASASVMRSVQAALAPLLAADPQAASDTLVLLGLQAQIVEALHAQGIANVARLAGADPQRLERDERIGAGGVAHARVRLRAYVEDREGLVVDAALPAWRIAQRAAYVENVARLGADAAAAIDVLESAGGFVLDRAQVPALREQLVAAPLWREDDLVAVVTALRDACAWPPKEIADLAAGIAQLGRERAMPALMTMPSETLGLMIERIAPLLRDIAVSAEGRLYRRDLLHLADALRLGAEGIALPLPLAQLLAAVEQRLPRLHLPLSGTPEFSDALERAGLVLLPDGRVERADALAREEERERPESRLEEVDLLGLSEAARRIVNATAGGGYRLVVAEPGAYAARVRKLASELRGALGERLRVIDFDAELLHALERDGKLPTALRVQGIKGPVAGAIEPIARAAAQRILDDLLQTPRGACALLVNAGALALTGAAHHLGKIYDRSRGGSHGLLVVCVPGDHPREHARFNRVLPLPIQPTERPIALDDAA